MTKTKGTLGGRIPRIYTLEEEKLIITILRNQNNLKDPRLQKLARRFEVHVDGEGEWPNGDVLTYSFKSAKKGILKETRVYAGSYRFEFVYNFYHDNKNHQSAKRTYEY